MSSCWATSRSSAKHLCQVCGPDAKSISVAGKDNDLLAIAQDLQLGIGVVQEDCAHVEIFENDGDVDRASDLGGECEFEKRLGAGTRGSPGGRISW